LLGYTWEFSACKSLPKSRYRKSQTILNHSNKRPRIAKNIPKAIPALLVCSLLLRPNIANNKTMPEIAPKNNCIQKLNLLNKRKFATNSLVRQGWRQGFWLIHYIHLIAELSIKINETRKRFCLREQIKRLQGWVTLMSLSNTLAVVGALLAALAFLILGGELLRPQGLVPK
jgi:hypothetical protein